MSKDNAAQADRTFLFIVLALVLFGLVMIASAGVFYSKTRFDDQYFFFKHQLFYGVVPGLLTLYVFQKINYRVWKKLAVPIFLVALVSLVMVFIPGVGAKIYGASRWIILGPLSFQPSELMKFAIVLYLAAWLGNRGMIKVGDLYEGLVPMLVVLGGVGFLIIKQPDTGTLVLVSLVMLAIYFASGARFRHVFGLIMAGIAGLGILIKMAPYRINRFMVFLNPETDTRGIGYQINQALMAIGSGGIFGLGLGYSRQKFNYLPEPVGDSIFAIIGEELGIIGAGMVVVAFVALGLRGLKIANNAPDEFSRLAVIGITAWIVFQAFINIGAITGIIPLTGMPLPFISYGGTSMIFLMAGVGILLNISKHARLE